MELPSFSDVGRRGFTGSSRVVRKDTSNSDLGAGQLAGGLDSIGAGLERRRDEKQTFAATQAQSEFLVAKAEADGAFDQDSDYETIHERYSEKVNGSLQAAAARITDPKKRELFLLNNQVTIARGQESMKDLAFGKETHVRKAEMQTNLQALSREVALGKVLPADASINAREMMEAAQEAGYLDAETASATLSSFKAQTTVAGLANMPAVERLAALAEPWTKDLPVNEILKLKKTADIELRRDAAVGFVDELIAADTSKTDARAALKAIDDKDLRREAEARWDIEQRRSADAKADELKTFNQDTFLPIRQGKMRVEDLDPADMERFTPQQVNALYAAQKAALPTAGKATPIKTDRGALTKVLQLRGKGDEAGARDYILENAGKFSDGDYESYLSEFLPAPDADEATDLDAYNTAQEHLAAGRYDDAKKMVADTPELFSPTDSKAILRGANPKRPTVKKLQTFKQRVEVRAGEMGIKGKKLDRLSDETLHDINDWATGIIEQTGVAPTDIEVNAEIDRRLVNVVINPKGLFNTRKLKGTDLSPDDYRQAFKSMDRELANAAVTSLKARGAEVTETAIVSEAARLGK